MIVTDVKAQGILLPEWRKVCRTSELQLASHLAVATGKVCSVVLQGSLPQSHVSCALTRCMGYDVDRVDSVSLLSSASRSRFGMNESRVTESRNIILSSMKILLSYSLVVTLS